MISLGERVPTDALPQAVQEERPYVLQGIDYSSDFKYPEFRLPKMGLGAARKKATEFLRDKHKLSKVEAKRLSDHSVYVVWSDGKILSLYTLTPAKP
jgi:hypothetical protein